MSRTVFILGAGASKQAGAPLMAEFLEAAERLKRTKKSEVSQEQFDLVFRARTSLQVVHSKSNLDLDNIESVFAAFEMAALFKRPLGTLSVEEVQKLPSATRRIIVETLEREISFPYEGGPVLPPPPYHDFVGLIKKILKKDPAEVSLITFNYDLALDYALHFNGLRVNYGFDESRSGLPLLKLHGSLNWARCSNANCADIVPWHLSEFFSNNNWDTMGMTPGSSARFNLSEHIAKRLVHCDKPRSSDPVIVPPTWNKTQHHHEISSVWQHAARHLSEAENIFVIGYSLPASDEFFRYLYSLGTVGDALLRRFWVFDPDATGTIEGRYKELLSPMTLRKYQQVKTLFANAMRYIEENTNLA